MNTWPRLILSALGLSSALYGTAHAGLAAVDPGPYTLATGRYPMWYEDTDNTRLELCQSKAISSRNGGYMCIIIPEPGVFDDLQPMVFPDNWPPELFWFLAETQIAPPPGNNNYEMEAYVAGIEAAFGQDTPADGDQVSFARIRMRINIPIAGEYTVTHPYGVETFTVLPGQTGRRAINFTSDIGIGAPGDYTGALAGAVGPFLRRAAGTYTEINPETGETETFLGDPGVFEQVTGSPFNTNYVEVVGPAGRLYTDVFSVSGKIYDNRQQTPLEVDRSTYRRTPEGTHMEVFASAPDTSSVCYREGIELVNGTPPSPCLVNLTPDNNGRFHVRQAPSGQLPDLLVITAQHIAGATRPTSTSTPLVDLVKVNTARYSWADRSLRIEAVSSDEVNVPDLMAEGYGRLSKNGISQSLTIPDLAQPPAFVTVKSSAGGNDREPVKVVGAAPDPGDPDQLPVALADSASTLAGAGPLSIDVLINDSDPAGGTLSIVDLTQPAAGQGSVSINGTQLIYTPPANSTQAFTASFSYRVENEQGLRSLPALVSVSVGVPPANQPPVAVNDSASAVAGSGAVLINVLDNDSDPEGSALSVVNLTQPAAGQGSASISGTQVSYTPPASVPTALTASFSYQAQDAQGATSAAATVTVQVSPAPVQENFTVTTATAQLRLGNRVTWTFDGTTSQIANNNVTVQVTGVNGMINVGTARVLANGRWRILTTGTQLPSANPVATITTSAGTVRSVPVSVQ